VLVAPSENAPPFTYTDLSPAGLRIMLNDSRKHIRNSEVDKAEAGSVRARHSAYVDTASFAFGIPSVCVAQEYVNVLEEFKRHHTSKDIEKALHVANEMPIIRVFESSKYHPAGKAVERVFNLAPALVNSNVHVYAKSNAANDHNAPVASRFGIPITSVKSMDMKGKVVIAGSSWYEVTATRGFRLDTVQEDVVRACGESGAAALLMLCRLDKEHNHQVMRNGDVTKPGLSPVMQQVVGYWRDVTIVPGLRPHNGGFWIVASNRREVFTEKADKFTITAGQNWNVALFYMSPQFYRANLLKNMATACAVLAGPDKFLARSFGPMVNPLVPPVESIRPGLESWEIKPRGGPAMTHALIVENADMADYYGDEVDLGDYVAGNDGEAEEEELEE